MPGTFLLPTKAHSGMDVHNAQSILTNACRESCGTRVASARRAFAIAKLSTKKASGEPLAFDVLTFDVLATPERSQFIA